MSINLIRIRVVGMPILISKKFRQSVEGGEGRSQSYMPKPGKP